MPIRYYPAIVERNDEGLYAHFPDLPVCIAQGATWDDLMIDAEKALAAHLSHWSGPIPSPSAMEAIPADPDVTEAGRILVRCEMPGKSVRVNITLDEGLLAAIDAAAGARAMSRSAFIAAGARAMMSN